MAKRVVVSSTRNNLFFGKTVKASFLKIIVKISVGKTT